MKPTRLQVALRRLIDSARDDREPLETVRTFADRLEAILREDLAGEEVGAWTHLETPTPWADRYLLAVKARLDAGVRDVAELEAAGGDPRSPKTLGREILEELVNVSGWAAILWHRMKDLEGMTATAGDVARLRAENEELRAELEECGRTRLG